MTEKLNCEKVNGQWLCSVRTVAQAAGVHRNAIHDALKRGRLARVRVLGATGIPRVEAQRYVASTPARARAARAKAPAAPARKAPPTTAPAKPSQARK